MGLEEHAASVGERDISVGADDKRSRRPAWLRRSTTTTVTVVVVVVLLVAISVGTGVALSGGSSQPQSLPPASVPGAAPRTAAPPITSMHTPTTTPVSTTTPAPTPAGFPPPAADGALVDDTMARQVVAAVWPKFSDAFATGNAAAVAQYADTDVRRVVVGWFDCACDEWPTAVQQIHVSVPPQSAYPVSFLAEIQEEDFFQQPIVVDAVFSRQGAGFPWLVSFVDSYVDAPPFLSVDSVAPAPALPTDVAAVGGELASFFQTVFDTGTPPTNEWTQSGSMKQETARIDSGRDFVAQNKLDETLTYSAGVHSHAFAVTGGALMCGEIQSQSTTTSADASPIVQPTDRSVFGEELSPGSYRSIGVQSLRDDCWYVSPQGSAPTGFLGGAFSRVGVPA